jgi:hypothetical protein
MGSWTERRFTCRCVPGLAVCDMTLPSAAAAPNGDATPEVLVDPAVAVKKFEREVETYWLNKDDWRRRGRWLLDAEFPNVIVAFAAPQLQPRAVVFGAKINFENFDLWAPSVRLIDPFTLEPYRTRDLPPALNFVRRVPVQIPVLQPQQAPGSPQPVVQGFADQPLLQNYGPDDVPFLCLPGVREYHNHPAHSGDDWMLHRDRGEGSLSFLLENLSRYGLEPLNGYQFGFQISGFRRGEAPA